MMKLLVAVLLAGSAALVLAGEVDTQAVAGRCGNSPTCDTPIGTNGWTDCTWLDNDPSYKRQCTAKCNSPYYQPSSQNPYTKCSATNGWEDPVGRCTPTSQNCQNTQPSGSSIYVSSWKCVAIDTGNSDYYTTCTGTCQSGYTPEDGVAPLACCNKYTGTWQLSGGCKTPKCSSTPPFSPPSGAGSWDCSDSGSIRTCTASCLSGQGNPTEPTTTCDQSTGSWSGITGSCKSQQCTGMMPPSSVPTPPNSEGWDLQYCQSLTISTWRCSANCKPDYSGTPYVDCDESTGRWGSVNGMCKYNPPNACSGTPSTIPDYTEGWTDCSVKGGVYTCRAPCLSGYNPGPQGVPTSTCSGSTGNSWSAIKGSCITGPPQPCSLTPPYGDPSNTIGWDPSNCDEATTGYYTCRAYCDSNSYASGGIPSATCDVRSGQWSQVAGKCIPTQPNTCTPPPTVPPPSNSMGWDKSKCYTTGGRPGAVTTTCIAACANGYMGANGYSPSSTCDWNTGKWSVVNGVCIPINNNDCSNGGYPTIPAPDNSNGWVCYDMGYGPYAKRVCTSACAYGYYGYPCTPTTECMGNGQWSTPSGVCMPYGSGGGNPCWGYPGGYPSCKGGKGLWKSQCGGYGYSYKSRTWSGHSKMHSPSWVTHGTACRATCTGGLSGYYQSKCFNGAWSSIKGGCR